MEGRPQGFGESNLRYTMGSNSESMKRDIVFDEKPATVYAIGPQSGADFHYLEAGIELGSFQVAGTARSLPVPFFVITCDYTLVMEEEFCAAAYLSQDPELLCIVAGGDVIRYVLISMLVLGVVLSLAGIKTLNDIISI